MLVKPLNLIEMKILKNKILFDMVYFCFLGLMAAYYFFITQSVYIVAWYFFLIGAYTMFVIRKAIEEKAYKEPLIHVEGNNREVVNTTAAHYIAFKGVEVTTVYAKRKYILFGEYIYHVKLDYPKDKEQAQPELTDEDLISQERFEELTERMKKRNQKA